MKSEVSFTELFLGSSISSVSWGSEIVLLNTHTSFPFIFFIVSIPYISADECRLQLSAMAYRYSYLESQCNTIYTQE
jgi:hypothetical protein